MNFSCALTSCAVIGMLIGNLAVTADRAKDFKPVANEVANRPVVTETEVYKMVCTVDGEGYCKEYSVRRITKE